LFRTVLADLQTPVGAFMRISGDSRYAFLLESVEGGERVARYSFLGANPEMIVRGRGDQTTIEHDKGTETINMRAIDFVRQYFSDRKLARRPGLAPLCGGAVGYLAYDAVRWFEPVLAENGAESRLKDDDAVWMFFRTILAFDRVRQQIEITSVILTEEAGGSIDRLRELYDGAVTETAELEMVLNQSQPSTLPAHEPISPDDTVSFRMNWSRKGFEDAVVSVKERIAAGDCYQVVLFSAIYKHVVAGPVSIYRALSCDESFSVYVFLSPGR